jgi:Leucine-rich repeat (LRR) protein
MFQPLDKLKTLILQNMNMHCIPDNLGEIFPDLEYLDLSNNKIKTVLILYPFDLSIHCRNQVKSQLQTNGLSRNFNIFSVPLAVIHGVGNDVSCMVLISLPFKDKFFN